MRSVGETWCSPGPEEVFALLGRSTVPWWFAGGWAMDLFLKTATRPHADLDVGCFRDDLTTLLQQLPGWDIRVANDGRLTPLTGGGSLAPSAHGLWCRPAGNPCWVFEILVEDREGSDWVFRRDRGIRRPSSSIVSRGDSDLRYLRPEIQLLYKAKDFRLHDDEDFRAAWPRMDAHARAWLVAQLRATTPDHSWLATAHGD